MYKLNKVFYSELMFGTPRKEDEHMSRLEKMFSKRFMGRRFLYEQNK